MRAGVGPASRARGDARSQPGDRLGRAACARAAARERAGAAARALPAGGAGGAAV